MLEFITTFANWVTFKSGLNLQSPLGSSVSFFIEDSIKIFLLIYIMLFVVSLFRAQLAPEKIKEYLSGKHIFYGYLLAVFLGIVTPFCSCSSIPLFITFVATGIPFGITMTFLISSPLISEVATVLLFSMPEAGVRVAFVYVLAGVIISIFGGWLCEVFHMDKYIENKFPPKQNYSDYKENIQEKIKSTIFFANDYAKDTIKEIWLYVTVGLIIGAFMHGYIPQEIFAKYLGHENFFAVPFAAVAGIPIYANHNSVLPIIQVLLMKGVPIGTALVMLMSITAISLPELIMLRKVLKWKILIMFVGFLFVSFIIVGYLINAIM